MLKLEEIEGKVTTDKQTANLQRETMNKRNECKTRDCGNLLNN